MIFTPKASAETAVFVFRSGDDVAEPFRAAQNRFWAKGRSREMHSTAVFARLAACSLNFLTEAAQTGVSMLGKMFKTTLLSFRLSREMADRSSLVSEKSGARCPTEAAILPCGLDSP